MTGFESEGSRSYSQEDIQQILQLAIARQTDDTEKEFSYIQLLEIAEELQISPESIKLAERDWIAKQTDIERRKAFNVYRQGRFKKRLVNYSIVNGFFLLIDFIGGYSISWSLYILLFCGLIITLDARNTFQTSGEEYEAAFQKWNLKYQMKQSINTVLNKVFKFFQS